MASPRSLQDVIDGIPNLVEYLYNDTRGTHSRIRGTLSPVPAEQSNWRDEQRAWRETAVLFDQSHHMPELYLSGPDALRLLTRVGVNNLSNLAPGLAKQFVATNARGQIIGECLLHDLGGTYELISGQPILNWVQFQAERCGYDVSIERDSATWDNETGRRRNFRFGMDGPNAISIFERVIQGDVPEMKFFHTANVRIAGVDVLALRHGMAGHRGVELSGPYDQGQKVREAILSAGTEYGLKPGGAKSYFSAVVESGWISYPLPAIYSHEDMRTYREWLPDTAWEARFQLGGSFYPPNVEDYYVTPFDFGYDRIVHLDHDFIGREALEALAKKPPRTKVALVWDHEDVKKVIGSQLGPGPVYKSIEFPISDYAQIHRDTVRDRSGQIIGLSTHGGYSVNEKEALSLAIMKVEHAVPGTEVYIDWGEANGGSRKPNVERHDQTTIQARVAAVPYAAYVRQIKYSAVRRRFSELSDTRG